MSKDDEMLALVYQQSRAITDLYKDCTLDCERMPECSVCGLAKSPVGRSLPLEMTGSYCDYDCPAYRQEPTPGHLWPGELKRLKAEESDDE